MGIHDYGNSPASAEPLETSHNDNYSVSSLISGPVTQPVWRIITLVNYSNPGIGSFLEEITECKKKKQWLNLSEQIWVIYNS